MRNLKLDTKKASFVFGRPVKVESSPFKHTLSPFVEKRKAVHTKVNKDSKRTKATYRFKNIEIFDIITILICIAVIVMTIANIIMVYSIK
jgi:hypothetical protein